MLSLRISDVVTVAVVIASTVASASTDMFDKLLLAPRRLLLMTASRAKLQLKMK